MNKCTVQTQLINKLVNQLFNLLKTIKILVRDLKYLINNIKKEN